MKPHIWVALALLSFTPQLSLAIPVQDQASGLTRLMQYLETHAKDDALEEFKNLYVKDGYFRAGEESPQSFFPRYLYSSKWGWLDMRHFFAAAHLSSLPLVRATWVIYLGEMKEINQEAQESLDAWDYEDLTSNLVGAYYPSYRKDFPDKADASELTTLEAFFTDLNVTQEPHNAPNWKKLPESNQKIQRHHYIKNKGYHPKFTIENADDGNEVDAAIIRLREKI